MSVPQLEDLGDLSGRRVLVRADFNVPLGNSEITDDLRIRSAVPTLKWLVNAGAHVTVCSHLGRPQGEPNQQYSMTLVLFRLAELVPEVELLENLRFSPGETGNDPAFVQNLIAEHDAYVNDAFGASHRGYASIVGPPQFLPSAAGRLLSREVEVLGALRASAKPPFVAVMGGPKVSDKRAVIEALLESVDSLIVGGGMCFTFLRAEGHASG
jgi:phosphoglycerate kinase